MTTFGELKSKIEKTFVNLYGKKEFKFFSNQFKTIVLENKDISELYYIYNDLTENKGLSNDLVNDYINESIEYGQILIENNSKELNKINSWINAIGLHENIQNSYINIDSLVYDKSIKNLENILESKKEISKILTTTKEIKKNNSSINLPLKNMVKVANTKLNENMLNLSEDEKKELKEIVKLDKTELKNKIVDLKKAIMDDLNTKLNESVDNDLKSTIQKTIQKIDDSTIDFYNYYKLKNLQEGL